MLKNWKTSSTSTAVTTLSMESPFRNEMESSPEYDMPEGLRESLRRISSNMESQEANGAIQMTHSRQLYTTPVDEVDAPSPQGINAPSFQVSVSSIRHPLHCPTTSFVNFSHSGVQRRGMLNSREELPIEEQLYQPLTSSDQGHEYAQIRQSPSRDYAEIPEKVDHSVQVRRATVSSYPYPTRHLTKTSLTLPHQINMASSVPARHVSPSRGRTGSTPVLIGMQSHSSNPHTQVRYTKPHSQASEFVTPNVQPYQMPVSSQHSLSCVGVEDPVRGSVTSTLGANGEVRKSSQQMNHLKPNQITPIDEVSEASHTHSAFSTDDLESQPWYKDTETNSIPPAMHLQHDISPYAVTLNSEIQASPYQEPSGSQGSLRTLQSSGLIKTVVV